MWAYSWQIKDLLGHHFLLLERIITAEGLRFNEPLEAGSNLEKNKNMMQKIRDNYGKAIVAIAVAGSYIIPFANVRADTLASTTAAAGAKFEATTGFTFSSVVDFFVSLLMQGLGLGLYALQQTWFVWLSILAIGAVLGLIYLGMRFIHGSH